MKAALKAHLIFSPQTSHQITDAIRKEYCGKIHYLWTKLPELFSQDGKEFSYVVGPFKLNEHNNFIQSGAAVLCQTEIEAKESCAALEKRLKKHLVIAQWAGAGLLGWATNVRRFFNEIGVLPKHLPDGSKSWVAFEREIDQDTLEVNVIRKQVADNEGEAFFWARKWAKEKSKSIALEPVVKNITPPPPPHCTALTKSDIEDLGNAKMIALQKQWPRCFEIFERQKTNPSLKIPDQQIEDAYTLDLVGNGSDLFNATGGEKLRPDIQLVSALHKAAHNFARRGKSKIIDSAIYLIAFNWELGWCYLSDDQLAEKLSEILGTAFNAQQVKKYRYRTLELVAKHLPGIPPNSN
jgi:hypothetical protein